MNKKVILNKLKENKEYICKLSYIFGEEKYKALYEYTIKNAYKNRWKINDNDDYIKNICIYSAVEFIDLEKLKKILNDVGIDDIDIDLSSEQSVYEAIKENIHTIENYKDISTSEDIGIDIGDYLKQNVNKSNILKISITSILILLITLGGFILVPHYAYELTSFGNVFNKLHNKIFNQDLIDVNYTIDSTKIEFPQNKQETIDLVHHMANTIIIAADNNAKRGLEDVNPANIEIAIDSVDKYMKDDELIKMLDRWRQGDFYNATIVHNYVWRMLNGEIGYAIAINQGRVEAIVDKYYR